MELRNNNFENWNEWKRTLKKAVDIGEKIGMSDDNIASVGSKIGNFLSHNVEPENEEHRLLKDMWDSANDTEKEVMTKVLVKMLNFQ